MYAECASLSDGKKGAGGHTGGRIGSSRPRKSIAVVDLAVPVDEAAFKKAIEDEGYEYLGITK